MPTSTPPPPPPNEYPDSGDPGENQNESGDPGDPNPGMTRKRSSGKAHGAFVRLGKARAAARRAKALFDFSNDGAQDCARLVFSRFGRGRNSAGVRVLLHAPH